MFKKESTLEDYLMSCQTLFSNASDAQISLPLETFGYPSTRVDEGRALFTKAKDQYEKQKKEYSDQYAVTESLNTTMAEIQKQYMRHVKVARVAFEEDAETITLLRLNGRRERSFVKWLSQAEDFYRIIDSSEAMKTSLAVYGITAEKVTEMLTSLENLKELHFKKAKETGEAQAATKERDAAIDELDKWLSSFVKIARIALEESPQLLEMLGIKVAS